MYNFVLDCSNEKLAEYLKINEDNAVETFVHGDLNWCLQTYLILSKNTDLPVTCSNRLLKDCINLVHSDTLLTLKGTPEHFIVCVRADYPGRKWSHYHLVQNKRQLKSNTAYIPHWVQPGLIGRDHPQRQGVMRVGYSGQVFNKNFAGSVSDWEKMLAPHGIEFVTLTNGIWHNLKDVDVLIGIRGFNSRPYNTKPPTKLFNAWHAKIPFIGGNDSAYKQVGVPGKDYLVAKTPKQALDAILRLKGDPSLYQNIVENGSKKAEQYTEERIMQVWVEVLTNQILKRYNAWKRHTSFEKLRFPVTQKLGLMQHKSKQIIKRVMIQAHILS
ncbi:MAG: hypothetical protein H7Y13_10365 [Sphingobacteriaceae bacterium]|nr:hypothetical protein [Sphingobacteriaceae bacterium]